MIEYTMFCKRCRYNLRQLNTRSCPECGRAFDPANAKTFRARPGFPKWVRKIAKTMAVLIVLLGIAAGVIEWRYQLEAMPAKELEEQGHSVVWSGAYPWYEDSHQWAEDIPWLYSRLQSVSAVYSENDISQTPEMLKVLRRFRDLKKINVSNSNWKVLPSQIFDFPETRALSIYKTPLTSLSPEIGKLNSLESLLVVRSQLTKLPPEVGQLQNLTKLKLWSNKIETVPSEIGQLSKLKHLQLSGNELTDLPAEVANLKSLTYLNIEFNRFTTIPSSVFKLSKLDTFICDSNPIVEVPPAIGNLINLKWLSLRDNGLTSLPPQFAKLTQLTELDLSENPITDDALVHLRALTRLETLDLRETKVTEAGIARLKKALPNCYIETGTKQPPVRGDAESLWLSPRKAQ